MEQLYVNTWEPSDIVTLEEIKDRYIQINGSEKGFLEYVESGFMDGLICEYVKFNDDNIYKED